MLQFEDSYFKGETRDGFYIEPMMKRCWAAQLEVLSDIDKVCKKHNIMYYAEWGTLLGAVRHHGFIPWDDDLDIGMRREDYMKFMQIAKEELPEHYVVHNMHTNVEVTNFLNRIVNSETIQLEEDFLRRYHGFPYVAGIDIFPVDYYPTDPGEVEVLNTMIKCVGIVSNAAIDENVPREEMEVLLRNVEEMCGVQIDRNLHGVYLQNYLTCLLEKIFMLYGKEESEELTSMVHNFIWNWDQRQPKSCYDSVIMMPFETIEIPVPVGYEALLRRKYGEDYMTPKMGTAGHDYPYFKEQREILRNWMRDNNIPDGQFEI